MVAVRFAQTGVTSVGSGGIYKTNQLIGRFVTGEQSFVSDFHDNDRYPPLVWTATTDRFSRKSARGGMT